MNKVFKNLFLALFLLFVASAEASEDYRGFLEVDFDYSMGSDDPDTFRKLFIKPRGKKDYDFFKSLYNYNKPSNKKFSDQPTIPKIIHQVWVGGSAIPAILKYYQKTCQDLHPYWEYKLWTDKEVDEWDFENKDLYNDTRNYAEKSDILRHQILKDFGGVYLDMDIKCLRPLDPMHYLYDAYFGLEFPMAHWGRPIIAPGIMASSPHHKVVTKVLERIRQNWVSIDKAFDEGTLEIYDSRTFHSIGTMRSMRPVTDAVIEQVKVEDNVIVLPATYFYPLIRLTGERLTDPLPIRFLRTSFDYFINMVDPFVTESIRTWLYDHYRPKDPFFVKGTRPESFSYHDYFAKDSTLVKIKFDNGFGLYDKRRKRIFKTISSADKVKYNIFESFYNNNNPYLEVKFNHRNKINANFHFINLGEEATDLELKNIESWKKYNPEMNAKIWNVQMLEHKFPGLVAMSQKIKKVRDRKFYIALKILKAEGGVYINARELECLKNLYELNNKYDFYGGFLPFSKKNVALTVDRNFFAAKANHWVIDRIIKDVDANNEQKDLATIIKMDLYKYQALGGKNIMLPPVYFHPLDDNIRKQNIFDKIHQFYFGYKPAFTEVNVFNSFAKNHEEN
jgi:hypothetical protein